MKNSYFTEKYQQLRKEHINLFKEQAPHDTTVKQIADGYTLYTTEYYIELANKSKREYHLTKVYHGSELLFEYETIDSHVVFCGTFIDDSSGKRFIVFKEDLYGYSVYDTIDKSFYRYFPERVLNGEEDFIWTDLHYNQKTKYAFVEACIWACPWDVLVVDFSNPMNDIKIVSLNERIDGSYELYQDFEFKNFNGYDTIIKADNLATDKIDSITITQEQCDNFIKKSLVDK